MENKPKKKKFEKDTGIKRKCIYCEQVFYPTTYNNNKCSEECRESMIMLRSINAYHKRAKESRYD